MYRALVTISAVAGLSCFLSHLEHAQGQRSASSSWVRTADGWEPSEVLRVEPRRPATPELHPLLVASFQLGASLFALLAFPSGGAVAERTSSRASRNRTAGRIGRQRKPQFDA